MRSRDFRLATLASRTDPFAFSPRHNFMAGGSCRLSPVISEEYDDSVVIWQPDVYRRAFEIYEKFDFKTVLDLGCGSGTKSDQVFDSRKLVHVDFADRRSSVVSDEIQFKYCDLESQLQVAKLFSEIEIDKPILIILSDVIEHLYDPRTILRAIRIALRGHPESRLLISTPDRHRIDGRLSDGVPINPAHVRQWTLQEFGSALLSTGFAVEEIGWQRMNEFDERFTTICAVVSSSTESYQSFLSNHELPVSAQHLFVSGEHAALGIRQGGIGTYVREMQKLLGSRACVLLANMIKFDSSSLENVLSINEIVGFVPEDLDTLSIQILEVAFHLTFLLDSIRTIESDDYCGYSFRLFQAIRSKQFPVEVLSICRTHGNHVYLDAAAGAFDLNRSLLVDLREREVIENADIVLFPSQFLKNLYESNGIEARRSALIRYPLQLMNRTTDLSQMGSANTVVFYGRPSVQKGWPQFVRAVTNLCDDRAFAELPPLNVILLGVNEVPLELREINGLVITALGGMQHAEVIEQLLRIAPYSVVCMPYMGDNRPLSIFECIDAGCRFISFDAGGIPEQIPAEFHGLVLSEPNSEDLGLKLKSVLTESPHERGVVVGDLRKWLFAESKVWNGQVIDAYESLCETAIPELLDQVEADVSVVVINFNGTREWLQEVVYGIRQSTLQPAEVIFADDCSDALGINVLREVAHELGEIPWRIVESSENQGLAATRNLALKQVQSQFVLFHDNDNALLPRYLRMGVEAMKGEPDISCVVGQSVFFGDGEIPHFSPGLHRPGFIPFGQDLGEGFRRNVFGDAMAVYRTSDLREIGGWGGHSRAMWEDYDLFVKLTLKNRRILVLPFESFLYRVRPNSMIRTYSEFDGRSRIVDALPVPKRFQLGLMRSVLQGVELESTVRKQVDDARLSHEELKRASIFSAVASSALSAMPPSISPSLPQTRFSWRKGRRIQSVDYSWSLGLFDDNWYLRQYLDVADSGRNALEHYANEGSLEGRWPNPFFDGHWYLTTYPDVVNSGMSSLEHYVRHGASEGRFPHPDFDTFAYLRKNPDVKAAGINPLTHFLNHGVRESINRLP